MTAIEWCAVAGVAFDGLIFFFLVFQWFWAGDHKKCTVVVKCPLCESTTTTDCKSGKH